MGFQDPKQILVHRPADDVIHLCLVVCHLSKIPGACHKAVIEAIMFRLAGGLDLDSVEFSATLGHQVVAGKILHRRKHAVPVSEKRPGNASHTHGTYLSG